MQEYYKYTMIVTTISYHCAIRVFSTSFWLNQGLILWQQNVHNHFMHTKRTICGSADKENS